MQGAKGDWRAWGWKFCLNSEERKYCTGAALLMGYHPQRQGGKVQAAEIKAVTCD